MSAGEALSPPDNSSTPCEWSYVGESGRTVEERMKEHKRAICDLDIERSEIARHVFESDHTVDVSRVSNLSILDKEPQWRKKIIKEAIWSKHFAFSNRAKFSLGDVWNLSDLK